MSGMDVTGARGVRHGPGPAIHAHAWDVHSRDRGGGGASLGTLTLRLSLPDHAPPEPRI
jgi:hypothetical protein